MVTLPEVAERMGITARALQVRKARDDKRRREGKARRYDLPPADGRAVLPDRFLADPPPSRTTSVAWLARTIDPWLEARAERLGR